MGHMNLCMVRDGARKQEENLFDLSYYRSLHVPGDRLAMASVPHSFDEKRDARQLEDDGGFNSSVFATHSWHTSGKGLIILTTDYYLNLFFNKYPDVGEDCSDEDFMAEMVKMVRKNIAGLRRHLGYDHELVTKKTLVKKTSKAIERLPEAVNPEADLTHVCAINFDVISDDEKRETDAMEVLSKGYHEIRKYVQVNGLVAGMHGGALNEFQSLIHWVSIEQDDVLVLEYDGMCTNRVFRTKRSRRTPADQLLKMEREILPKKSSWMAHLEEFVYLREFMNSQGYELNI